MDFKTIYGFFVENNIRVHFYLYVNWWSETTRNTKQNFLCNVSIKVPTRLQNLSCLQLYFTKMVSDFGCHHCYMSDEIFGILNHQKKKSIQGSNLSVSSKTWV